MKAHGASPRNPAIYVALIPAVVALAAWSLGLSAYIRGAYNPPVPKWLIIGAVAAAILGLLMLAVRGLRTGLGKRLATFLAGCLLVPLFVALFGWAYFWLADLIARKRQPGATLVLAAGLGVTVFGFGIATSMEFVHLAAVFAGSLLGLSALRLRARPAALSMTQFGFLHCVTLFGVMVVASVEDTQRRNTHSDPAHADAPIESH